MDGTSGTLVCTDAAGEALRSGIMYDDLRAEAEAEELSVPTSFAVAKMLWLVRHEPETVARTMLFTDQADFIACRLGAEPGVSDYSNALKSGYDLIAERWGQRLGNFPDIRSRLPRIVAPGARIGSLRPDVADDLGLPAGLAIVSGATDGTTAFLASGATRPGDSNTTLGTTLVFKALSTRPGDEPGAAVYSHKLPGGFWLPGAASSTGGAWLRAEYPNADLSRMDREVERLLPCDHLAYPLVGTGERFPFDSPHAAGFIEPTTDDPLMRYAAQLQGVALVERLGYEILDRITGRVGEVYATGGGSRSDIWTQLRANVTGRVYHRPETPESALGAAVLAAAGTVHGDVWKAIGAMVRQSARFEPDPRQRETYDRLYGSFKKQLRQRGYLPDSQG